MCGGEQRPVERGVAGGEEDFFAGSEGGGEGGGAKGRTCGGAG